MVIKRSIPTWFVVLAVILALAAVSGLIMTINPTVDRNTLIRLRTKPGSASTAPPTGMPRGTPIVHAPSGPAPGSRQKPTQG